MTEEETKKLRLAGIPAYYWDKELDWPLSSDRTSFDRIVDDVQAAYNNTTNIAIYGLDRATRMGIATWLAQHIMKQGNALYRNDDAEGIEPKREPGTEVVLDGEVFTQPYTIKMMDVNALRNKFSELQSDDESGFDRYIEKHDFFFITEIGNEWPTAWYAKIVMDTLTLRRELMLPTIVTVDGKISDKMDKYGEYVYREIADFIKSFEVAVKLK